MTALQLIIGFHCNHEELLVLRTTLRLATVPLSNQIGVVDLHEDLRWVWYLALGHCLYDLVLDPPDHLVVHPKVPH